MPSTTSGTLTFDIATGSAVANGLHDFFFISFVFYFIVIFFLANIFVFQWFKR